MSDIFKVKKIEKATKAGCVVVTVNYIESGKDFTFVRKAYNDNTTYIQGYEISFHKQDGLYVVDSVEQAYETKGKKVSNTTGKKISENIKQELEHKNIQVQIPEVKQPEPVGEKGEVFHEKFSLIKTCVENKIPVYLAGPAGSGKNHTLEQVAWQLGLEFYFTNSIQQEYKLTGFIDAGGIYHETEFYKAFTNGGIFFLDEMDASIPEVLVLLNAAIANGYFEFPNGKVTAHEQFRVVAAGNTVGSGADDQYTGRLVLDQATLDRFCIIEFGYSLKIEMALSKNNIDLVDFVRDLREQATKKGVRATFSYRCITMVAKLEDKLPLVDILSIAVMKGLDKDTINTFSTPYGTSNKYYKALNELKKVA